MIRSPSAVLFDLDGTLLDTANDLAHCLNLLLTEENRPALSLAAIRLHVSNGANAMLDYGFGDIPDSYKQKLRLRFLKLYEENIATHTVWFEGLEDFTASLREHGIPWGIVTNKPRRYTDLLLDAMKMTSILDVVVCPDDLNIAKPDPRPMLHACQQTGAEPSTSVYIGDHIRDIEAGRAAGMKTIAAAYGYLEEPQQVFNWQANYIATKSTDITQLFEF